MARNNHNCGMHIIKMYAWNNHPSIPEDYDKYKWMLGEILEAKVDKQEERKNISKSKRYVIPPIRVLLGRKINSSRYGIGIVEEASTNRINIEFENGKRIYFAYPLAFSSGAIVLA